ncbi:hypothetical protein BDV96DRAFT_561319 [Lophiotrema nucula]|uniref:Heterokaryon incompatibility domain-containing protein n=1 Tax=Lophiotrema nucula TaxID=690887 RepID=A0A6A5ZUV7_9PLEO|nr:hypothetical protein BDV96DRAFT_561319 [Lophiotrema nucula]
MIRPALRMWLRWWMWFLLKLYDTTVTIYSTLSDDEAEKTRQQLDRTMKADAPTDAMRDWPRRLLHVPTMTSYEWQLGNVYGGIKNPAYNILTYTWGRWALREALHPEVVPIQVEGISWSIPRVHPSHFTSTQFQKVTKACTTQVRNPAGWLINRSRPVEFLWLDVACIAQDRKAASVDEIGRQAKIFFEAEETFVWLTTFDFDSLKNITDQLEQCIPRVSGAYEDVGRLEKRLQLALDSLRALLSDPWFESLWTLQEAYLRPDAILLSQEGLPVSHNAEKNRTLLRVLHRASAIYNFCLANLRFESSEYAKVRKLCLSTIEAIDKAGLAALSTQNPLAVYGVSRSRSTLLLEDRIYGIQQIFELRLGRSKPGSKPTDTYSLVELEEQLGAELLARYPILSQLHVIMEPAKLGAAWRVGPKSIVPKLDLFGNGNWKWISAERPLARLSTHRSGVLWGYFEGRVCEFASLQTAWASVDSQPRYSSLLGDITSVSIFQDNTEALLDSPEYQENRYQAIPRDRRQHALARWLCKYFADEKLCVLLLGNLTGPGRVTPDEREPLDLRYYVGLMILQQEKAGLTYWHRLGFCAWEIEHLVYDGREAPEKAFLEGEGNQWQPISGIFG